MGIRARGLEFSTQPFDVPRRYAVAMHRLVDAPTFRWLPARSAVDTEFLMTYREVPDTARRVRGVRVEGTSVHLDVVS